MSGSRTAAQVLDEEFLVVRAKLLEVAAAFDRLDRADGQAGQDPRLQNLRKALDIVASDRTGRAEQLQLLFSREYEPEWRTSMHLDER